MNELAYMELNHIHRLGGFFIDDVVYNLALKQETRIDYKSPNILVNYKFDRSGKILRAIKNFVRLDLIMYDNYDNDTTYYVTLNKRSARQYQFHKDSKQVAGAWFPVSKDLYDCEDLQVHVISRFVPFYTEPAIEYIKSLGCKSYARFADQHERYGNATFNYLYDMLTPENFANHRSIILTAHLLDNKYAHNGIGGQEDLDTIYKMFQSQSYKTLELIHSFCHVYDILHMIDDTTTNYRDMIWTLNDYAELIEDDDELQCFIRFINKGAGDFLQTNEKNEYLLPYIIKQEALDSKKRLYNSICRALLDEFKQQICYNRSLPTKKSTSSLPNN